MNITNAIKKQKAIAAEKKAEEKAAAQQTAEKIGKVSVEIKTKAGEGGRIFGSITSKDIADALKAQHNITVDKKKSVSVAYVNNIAGLAGPLYISIQDYYHLSLPPLSP